MLPAQERLDGHDGSGREVDERLVVEPELGALEGPPQIVLHRRPVDGLGVHLGVEQDGLADRVRLRPVERDLRLLEQVQRLVGGRRGNRELLQFLYIASGSASELAFQLRLACALGFGEEATVDAARTELLSLQRMLNRLTQHLANRPVAHRKTTT